MRTIKTFTLIEILIVIVIIGILSAALIPRLQGFQWRARDTQRVTDISRIYTAMNIYFLDNGSLRQQQSYYGGNDAALTDFSSQSGWSTSAKSFMSFLETAGIMTSVPMDPINNMSGANTAGEFAYRYFCYDGVNIGYFREYPTRATRYAVTGPFDTYRFSSNSYCKNS